MLFAFLRESGLFESIQSGMIDGGLYNGYVAFDNQLPYNDLDQIISIHGGITFDDNINFLNRPLTIIPITRIPEFTESKCTYRVVGFDTQHFGDTKDTWTFEQTKAETLYLKKQIENLIMKDIIYFSVNNWSCGKDYPNTKKFKEWLGDDLNLSFNSDSWAKENKLCIYSGCIDMSTNFTVSAPKEWVLDNCPEIIDSEFQYLPEPGEDMPDCDRFDMPFREYTEDNFGSEYYETGWWDYNEEEYDEEDN